MNEFELTDRLKKEYVKEVTGERKHKTLEEALQEALDNTTPSFPGAPDIQEEPEEEDAEWI